MSDIALIWDARAASADIALYGGSISIDDGLRTAVIVSLFTDARARPDDVLPTPGGDRRGWWGDAYAELLPQDAIGSRLWLLSREKITPSVINRARDYAREALDWMIRDGIASAIDVQVEAQGSRRAIGVTIDRPTGPAREKFDLLWEATA